MTENNRYYVYALIDPRTALPFYIGKGTKNRAYLHLTHNKVMRENRKKHHYIKGLRNKGLEPEVKIIQQGLTEPDAYSLETELIRKYGRKDFDPGGILTNLSDNHLPPTYAIHPMKGRTYQKEWTEKRLETYKRNGTKSPLRGIPRTKEMRDKISSKWLIISPAGESLEVINLNEFARSIGIHPESLRKSSTYKSGKTKGGWRAEKL